MSESLSHRDKITLATIARVRGIRAETLLNYPQLKSERSPDAVRKQLERLCDHGFLAASPLPRGPRLFRLSSKGVALTGAPPAYANSPSVGIGAEMLAVSALAWRTDEFLFPTKGELEGLLSSSESDSVKPRLTSRFVLRPVTAGGIKAGSTSELHLHAFMAELRPAEELAKRIEIIVQQSGRSTVLAGLIQSGLFGVTAALPSRGVKASLETKSFAVETALVVVEELQDLINR
jgi:hypothetical protein